MLIFFFFINPRPPESTRTAPLFPYTTPFTSQLAIFVGTLAIWETLVVTGAISEFFFGQPSKVVAYLVENTLNGYLLVQTWVTLYEELMGFVIGTVVGTAAGLSLWWSPFLSRVLEPFAVVFNATPKIVVAPILIVWFGIGLLSKVMIAVLIRSEEHTSELQSLMRN